MEHRCGQRRPCHVDVTIRSTQGIAARGQIRDISASGALLLTAFPARLNVHVLVEFEPARHRRDHVVRAEIVREVSGGFAVEWAEFSPAIVRALLRRLAEMESLNQPLAEPRAAVNRRSLSSRSAFAEEFPEHSNNGDFGAGG